MQACAGAHFPFLEAGWRGLEPPGRKDSDCLQFGRRGQSSTGPKTQAVWEGVMEKVQNLYCTETSILGVNSRSQNY